MTHVGKRFRRALRRLGLSESGAATVELVIVFPFFVGVFLSSYDVAMMNMRAVMMEQAMDKAVRRIRLSSGASLNYNQIVKDICEDAYLIPDCRRTLRIEMTPVSTQTWAGMVNNVDCVKRNQPIQPLVKFKNGAENELMLMRICAVVDPVFPGIGVGRTMPKDASGGYKIIASSAFVNEPN